uniref:Uncharacterized protein n=1 Tax=Cacopsylla melanoneura TaxID=428564 RepID=A0A8D8UBB8_9HEMI
MDVDIFDLYVLRTRIRHFLCLYFDQNIFYPIASCCVANTEKCLRTRHSSIVANEEIETVNFAVGTFEISHLTVGTTIETPVTSLVATKQPGYNTICFVSVDSYKLFSKLNSRVPASVVRC